jgi:hypothetical protein
MIEMVNLNTRDELVEFLYGADSTSPDTLVGVVIIGGELLAEALADPSYCITDFFPSGDEGECIEVDDAGNVVSDYLYY